MRNLILVGLVSVAAVTAAGAKTKEQLEQDFDSPKAMCDYVANRVLKEKRASRKLQTMLNACTYLIVGDYLGQSQETIFETQPIEEDREVELY